MDAIAIGSRCELTPQLLDSMYEFRRGVFVNRLSWALPMPNGVECDEYDTGSTTYFIVHDEQTRVTACARLISTAGRYMLPELFPQLLGSHIAPRDESIWELSRFALSVTHNRDGRALALSKSTLDMLDLVFEFARRRRIAHLALVTSLGLERLMLRSGIEAHRIAAPAMVNGSMAVALYIDVPAVTHDRELH